MVPDRYDEKDTDENYVIEAQEDDDNFFNKDYFGKGYRWHNQKFIFLKNHIETPRNFLNTIMEKYLMPRLVDNSKSLRGLIIPIYSEKTFFDVL